MKFKINAKTSDSEASILQAIKRKFPDAQLKFELQNADKVLEVHGIPEDSNHASQVESAIKETGFDGAWLTQGLENA